MRLLPYLQSATYLIQRACQTRSYTTQAIFEPLRILFCGSDEFSIASLRALYKEHERDKALIESIDVVCRPAKPVGRGLKDTREGKSFLARFSISVLNEEQYPSPWWQRNWPCLYIRLIPSLNGRLVFDTFTVIITSIEKDVATEA